MSLFEVLHQDIGVDDEHADDADSVRRATTNNESIFLCRRRFRRDYEVEMILNGERPGSKKLTVNSADPGPFPPQLLGTYDTI